MEEKIEIPIPEEYSDICPISDAEFQAKKNIPMTMEDWSIRLNKFLDFNEVEILQDKGRVSAEIAKSFAETEFEKYRIIQDKSFQSDFDIFLEETKKIEKNQNT